MRRRLAILLGFALVLFAFAPAAMAGHGNGNGAHVAHLSGTEEVPPVDTNATGNAIFKMRGDSLNYKLIVANIDDVVAAHIHCAPDGVNGPVGVTLFSGDPTSSSGILAQGNIEAPDDENGCGWANLEDVTAAIDSGNAYVNVHTLGSPPGEIRGQIS